MNQIGQIIAQRLESIEKVARQTLRDVEAIRGVCVGYAAAMRSFYSPSPPQTYHSSNGFQEIFSEPATTEKSVAEIIEEVKKLIIELKIKGSVREHRNGLIKFTNTVFGCVYGRTKEEIEEKLKEKIKQFNKNNKSSKDKKTKAASPLLSEFYRTDYLPFKIREGRNAKTIEGYECRIRFIKKSKFDKPLNWYKAKEIENFLYSFPEPRKRQIMRGFLNNLFTRAVTVSQIKVNPCSTVVKPKHKQGQGTAFSFKELTEFLTNLTTYQHLPYNDKCYFIFCLLVGTRRDEALTVSVNDVDFQNKILHIRGTKTTGSNRDVPLTPLVEKLLHSLGIKSGRYFKSMTEAKADTCFRKVWEKEKGHKLHDLRHTYGTIQICVAKQDVKTVSLLLGHSGVEMTLKTYTHPEQLDKGTFLRGDLSDADKMTIYKKQHDEILQIIEKFIYDESD